MASVLKFITVCQKILILLSILCFIPTSIFVFSPKNTSFTNQQISGYANALKQIDSSFIVSLQANSNCTWRQALLNNEYCFKRGRFDQFYVQEIEGASKCNGYSYKFQGFQYCSGYSQQENGVILNRVSNNSLVHSDVNYPIFNIYQPFSSPIIVQYHYLAFPSHGTCKMLGQSLTKNIQEKYSLSYYQNYEDSERLLWYYSIPILGFLLVLIIVNQFSDSLNLRRYILISSFWLDIALIVLIAKGIYYFTTVENFSLDLHKLSTCFGGASKDIIYSLSSFPRLSFGFIFFVGIVMLIVFLSMIGLLIMKIIEWKYNKSRQISSTGVQLTELKTSLRSRIKNIEESHSSKRFVLVDSEL